MMVQWLRAQASLSGHPVLFQGYTWYLIPSITPVPEDITPFSGLHGNQVYKLWTDIHTGKISTQMK